MTTPPPPLITDHSSLSDRTENRIKAQQTLTLPRTSPHTYHPDSAEFGQMNDRLLYEVVMDLANHTGTEAMCVGTVQGSNIMIMISCMQCANTILQRGLSHTPLPTPTPPDNEPADPHAKHENAVSNAGLQPQPDVPCQHTA